MLTGVLCYVVYCADAKRRKRKTFVQRWGPTIVCVVALLLVMIEPSRHLIADQFAPVWTREYKPHCDTQSWKCLSGVGWFSTIGCTYVGFAFLFVGTMWNAELLVQLRKIKDKWRELRGA